MRKPGWIITKMYKHIFGPVPSRRLGMSLGIDLIPQKVCSLNCVYCECGRTTNLTVERKEYVSIDEVKSELSEFLTENPKPDYITFSGAGEPTLNSGIGEVLNFIKKDYPEIPAAVLTNGTLLYDPELRKELLPADVVLPSLDAARRENFLKIDRPHKDLDLSKYIQGLIDFRKEFSGEIWLEVLILPGYNDDRENLLLLKEAFTKINPDRIQINTLDRPGTVENLRPANKLELESIKKLWDIEGVEIISPPVERENIISYRDNVEAAIMETISRRPCTLSDLSAILGIHINEINKYLGVLDEAGKITAVRQDRGVFYSILK